MDDIVSAVGLLLTMLGAGVTCLGVYVSAKTAGEIAVQGWVDENPETWKELPLAKTLRKSSFYAIGGLGIIFLGTVFQLVPVALRLWLRSQV